MARNPWQSDPGELAKALAVLERRRGHLSGRLADPARRGASRAHDEAEAAALELAGLTLLRCYLEVVTGVRSDELVRALREAATDAELRARATRFLAMVPE